MFFRLSTFFYIVTVTVMWNVSAPSITEVEINGISAILTGALAISEAIVQAGKEKKK